MVEPSYFETKDIAYIIGMVLIASGVIGGFVYDVYDTGEEITCRTGDGWTVLEENEGFFKAQCQYITKEWTTAYCSSFRSTNSYSKYGCNVVVLVEKITNEETIIDNSKETVIDNTITKEVTVIVNPVRDAPEGKQWICPPNGVECELVK